MKIFAFGHKSNVGKDLMCNLMMRHAKISTSGLKILKRGFAYAVKEKCYEDFHKFGHLEPDEYEHNRLLRSQPLSGIGHTPLELWISVGEFYRKLYPKIWITKLFEKLNGVDILFIQDLRFYFEIEEIKARGGKIYKINKPGENGLNSVADNELNFFNDWDGVIENDGTVQDLMKKAEKVFNDS